MYGPYLDHFLRISSNSFILLVKKFLSFTRDAVIKKKIGISKEGGGLHPISKLFRDCLIRPEILFKKLKFEVSSHTFDTIWAILTDYGQFFFFCV